MVDETKIVALRDHVIRLVQDLANYRLLVGEDGKRTISPDEASVHYNMTLFHCEEALEDLSYMGLG
jgi:hypothetical protein